MSISNLSLPYCSYVQIESYSPTWACKSPWFFLGVGIILGDFNICDPEEGRFNVWNQTFTDGDPAKTAEFHSFFPYVPEVAQSDYTRRDATVLGVTRTLSRIDRFSINLPMAEARDFRCSSHVFEDFGKKTFPSDHAAARLVIQKPTNRRHHTKRFPNWMSKLFFGVLSCNNFMMTTVSLLIHFVHWPN